MLRDVKRVNCDISAPQYGESEDPHPPETGDVFRYSSVQRANGLSKLLDLLPQAALKLKT
jgi:hypothetical protein